MSKQKVAIDWTSNRLLVLIAARHGLSGQNPVMAEEWALFYELQSGTGGHAGRRMDAFAMNCWPSKGFTRVGYEVKVSRSDMLRELNDASKRQWALDMTNEFWFVCAPGIVKPEEIPEGLGLLVPGGGGLRALVRAKHRVVSETMAPWEVAAILRAACEYKPLRDARWKHQGRDLTIDELDAILAERRPYAEQAEIDSKAKAKAGSTVMGLQEACSKYSAACAAAGVKPPHFLDKIHRLSKDNGYGGVSDWEAERWVKENVTPGPEVTEIEDAMRVLEYAESRHEDVKKKLERLLIAAKARAASHAHASATPDPRGGSAPS